MHLSSRPRRVARALNQGLEIAAGAAVPDLACGTSSLVTEDEISLVPCSVPDAFKATLLPSLDKRASRGRPFMGFWQMLITVGASVVSCSPVTL